MSKQPRTLADIKAVDPILIVTWEWHHGYRYVFRWDDLYQAWRHHRYGDSDVWSIEVFYPGGSSVEIEPEEGPIWDELEAECQARAVAESAAAAAARQPWPCLVLTPPVGGPDEDPQAILMDSLAEAEELAAQIGPRARAEMR